MWTECHSLAYGCYICGLTHSFVYLVCSVPRLFIVPFGLGREQSTASCLGFFQGWTWERKGCCKLLLLLPASQNNPPCFPVLQALSCQALRRYMILVQTEIQDEGQERPRTLPTDFQPWISGFLQCSNKGLRFPSGSCVAAFYTLWY